MVLNHVDSFLLLFFFFLFFFFFYHSRLQTDPDSQVPYSASAHRASDTTCRQKAKDTTPSIVWSINRGSCHKSFVATNTCLSRQTCVCHGKTRLLSRQRSACRDKIMFVVTSILWSRQKTCFVASGTCLSRQKHIFVARKDVFVVTELLLRQK